MSIHEEEVLGKAYDSVLMWRLLGYLRPYKAQVALALGAIVCGSILQLAQPYLMKVAIDRYIATGDFAGIEVPDRRLRADHRRGKHNRGRGKQQGGIAHGQAPHRPNTRT